jgi:hypothetical protein
MAGDAGLVFKLTFGGNERADRDIPFRDGQRRASRGNGVHGVAIIAPHIIAAVPARLPERQVPVAGMTAHTGLSLFLRGNCAFAKAYRMLALSRIAHVVRIGSVASRACLAAPGGRARVSLRAMLRIKHACLILMTAQAYFRVGLCLRFRTPEGWEKNEKRYCEDMDSSRSAGHAHCSLRFNTAYAFASSGIESEIGIP